MRALSPVLAALAAFVTHVAHAGPPALLVLRAACQARDPALFRYSIPRRHTYQLLPYEQTCGPNWSVSVTQAALVALSEGRIVSVVGWAGAVACEALSAAAHALRRAAPAACARSEARAAGVARLAARLGWRHALLPRPPPRTECHAALHHVALALATLGLTTIHPDINDDRVPFVSYVVIVCASRESGVSVGVGSQLVSAADAVLLLHVDEEPHLTAEISPTDDASRLSNKKLMVDGYIRIKRIASELTASSFLKVFSEKATDTKTLLKVNNISKILRNQTVKKHNMVNKTISRLPELKLNSEADFFQKPRYVVKRDSKKKLVKRRPDYLFSVIDEIMPQGSLLLLSDQRLDEDRPQYDINQVYKEAFDNVDRCVTAEKTRTQISDISFHLYQRYLISASHPSTKWSRVAFLTTVSSRSLDDSKEWHTDAVLSNMTGALLEWNEKDDEQYTEEASWSGGTAGAGACLALGAAGGAALAARWAAVRRRRARRCGDVVLAPTDFTFPADERRCVGDGMETMLSCWLQQLHEFGGPELERPDLLKQPPRPPPRAPSAPSSTCSVNRITLDRRTRYKGDAVHLKYLQTPGSLELKRKAIDVLLVMQNLRHENLNPFIGCLCCPRGALVFDECGRGSLEDVLMADEIKLDWTFRLSLLTDLVKGMRYLHASPLRVHGRLSSRNCVVDSRWVLRLTDYGLPAFHRAQPLPLPHRSARELLWTAPELLRDPAAAERGSQPGDVFSFAIVMQEVIVRGEPYCMLALTPEEIVEKVSHPPPLIRPSVSMGAAPPEAVSVMRQCWSEAPDLRPDFHRLHDIFRHLHRGRKINIVDSMFEMLEKYSNNLEELIKERTEQLDMEKKKTEQLLNRMLPRSVAERLLMGSRVEPEEFEEVSIYFSDIVGFTALAARSTPVQVVDLLNDLYTTFDAAIEQYRVYKVETIGDAYMVVGGLPARTRDHAESVATMALHLLHLAGAFRVRHLPDTPLRLRIGLHTGPCCAGVVGLTMPRYCLFGDTVNTASRMESTGAAWRIQISAATAERLTAAGGYRLRSRGLTQIKGKGAMHTYWLLGKDGFDKPLPTPPPLPSEEVLFETDGENDSEASSSGGGAAPVRSRLDSDNEEGLEPAPPDQGWQRSGAVSADSSPPRAGRDARMVSAASVDRSAPYSRYRWLGGGGGGGGRTLRRQWSLERGEALATAAASLPALPPRSPRSPPAEALALLAPSAPRAAPPPRYRTRPDPAPDEVLPC